MWLLYFLGGAVSCLVFIGLISLFTDHTNQDMNIKLLEVRVGFLEQKMKKYEEEKKLHKTDTNYLREYFLPKIKESKSDSDILNVLTELEQVAFADGVADLEGDK